MERIYQTPKIVFHGLSKHLDYRQNTPLRVVFSTLVSTFGNPDETLSFVFDILHQTRSFVASLAGVLRLVTRSSPRGEERVTSLRMSAWEARSFVFDILLSDPTLLFVLFADTMRCVSKGQEALLVARKIDAFPSNVERLVWTFGG